MLYYRHKFIFLHAEINCDLSLLKSKVNIDIKKETRNLVFFYKRSKLIF